MITLTLLTDFPLTILYSSVPSILVQCLGTSGTIPNDEDTDLTGPGMRDEFRPREGNEFTVDEYLQKEIRDRSYYST